MHMLFYNVPFVRVLNVNVRRHCHCHINWNDFCLHFAETITPV